MNRIFPEAGPDTTNLRWGIESILSSALDREGMITELEVYFTRVVYLTDPNGWENEGEVRLGLDEAALQANIRFEE